MREAWEERHFPSKMKEDQLEDLYSVFVAIFAIGGMLGGFSGGIIANRFGRYVVWNIHSYLNKFPNSPKQHHYNSFTI